MLRSDLMLIDLCCRLRVVCNILAVWLVAFAVLVVFAVLVAFVDLVELELFVVERIAGLSSGTGIQLAEPGKRPVNLKYYYTVRYSIYKKE